MESDLPGLGPALALASCVTLGQSPHWLKKNVTSQRVTEEWLAGEIQRKCPPLRKLVARDSDLTNHCPSLQLVLPSSSFPQSVTGGYRCLLSFQLGHLLTRRGVVRRTPPDLRCRAAGHQALERRKLLQMPMEMTLLPTFS